MTQYRTLLKILLNPILRKFGWCIVSCIDDTDKFLGYGFKPYPECCSLISEEVQNTTA
jgi:hypothetical protein